MTEEKPEDEYFRLRRGDAAASSPAGAAGAVGQTGNDADKAADAEPEQLDDSIDAAAAEALKEEGNTLFRASSWAAAAERYTRAASSAHAGADARAVYLANRAACRLKQGEFKAVDADASAALKLRPDYRKALGRRREARERLGDFRGALADARALGEHASEISRLARAAEQKETKDREEAMESLKGLGNSILSNFGMSLDDFSMQQDPSTGSYSINMRK